MKKSTLILGGLVLVGAGYALYNFANQVIANIEYSFQNVKWVGFKDKQANFSVSFTIKNKNLFPISIFGFKGIVSWRNTAMSNINTAYSATAPLILTPQDSKTFTMYFNIALVDLTADLAKLLFGQKPPVGSNYKGLYVEGAFDGELKGVRGHIPVSEPLTLSI